MLGLSVQDPIVTKMLDIQAEFKPSSAEVQQDACWLSTEALVPKASKTLINRLQKPLSPRHPRCLSSWAQKSSSYSWGMKKSSRSCETMEPSSSGGTPRPHLWGKTSPCSSHSERNALSSKQGKTQQFACRKVKPLFIKTIQALAQGHSEEKHHVKTKSTAVWGNDPNLPSRPIPGQEHLWKEFLKGFSLPCSKQHWFLDTQHQSQYDNKTRMRTKLQFCFRWSSDTVAFSTSALAAANTKLNP